MARTLSQPWWRGGVFMLAACLLGCSGSGGGSGKVGEAELRGIAVLYGQYQSAHQGKTPPSEAEFKKFIKGLPKERLAGFGVLADNVEQIFTSPRDNQPIQVRYNLPRKAPGDGKGDIVAFEKVGSGGRRLVAFSTTQVEDLDEAKFKELLPGQ